MDAACTIQDSIHVFSLVHKYVSRILGTYQIRKGFLLLFTILIFIVQCLCLHKNLPLSASYGGLTTKKSPKPHGLSDFSFNKIFAVLYIQNTVLRKIMMN